MPVRGEDVRISILTRKGRNTEIVLYIREEIFNKAMDDTRDVVIEGTVIHGITIRAATDADPRGRMTGRYTLHLPKAQGASYLSVKLPGHAYFGGAIPKGDVKPTNGAIDLISKGFIKLAPVRREELRFVSAATPGVRSTTPAAMATAGLDLTRLREAVYVVNAALSGNHGLVASLEGEPAQLKLLFEMS